MATSRAAETAKAIRQPTAKSAQPSARRTAATRAGAKVAPMDDYEGVRQVLSRYCFALDSGQLDLLGPLFHREASFSVSFEAGTTHTGRTEIQAWYEQLFSQRADQARCMRHKIYEPQLSISGTQASSVVYFDADSLHADGSVRVVAGRYDDTLVKERGRWFFKDRTITVLYNYTPGKGQEGM